MRRALPVASEARGFQAVNQLAVGQAVLAGGGADALNPQAALLELLDAAGGLGVAIGAIGGFLPGMVETNLWGGKSFFTFLVLFMPLPAPGNPFYPGPRVLLLFCL